jgi:hypothetical protein
MLSFLRSAAVVLPLTSISAFAQNSTDVTSAASEAASALKSAAKDKLLIADLIGADVTGPSGSRVGTMELEFPRFRGRLRG